MKFIKVNSDNEILMYHNKPELLSENDKQGGFLVDIEIPVIPYKFGEKGVLKYNQDTQSAYVEYVGRPLTIEEQMQELKDSLDYMILQSEGLV